MYDFSGLKAIQWISAVMDSESEGLFSEEKDCEESTFIPSAQATQPNSAGAEHSNADLAPLSMDLQDTCKRAAEQLGIPWPSILAETTSSCYEGKWLPRAKQTATRMQGEIESIVAFHLHPGQKTMTGASFTFPPKSDGFQSSMTEKSYRSVATAVRALNT
ncbi:hypothetical protein MHYP_G00278850 [Metynnis hypsauchen]